MTRFVFSGLVMLVGFTACSRDVEQPPDGGGGVPVHKQVGDACSAAEGLTGGCELWHECYRGQCRVPCTEDMSCNDHGDGEICLNLSAGRGYCSLNEMRCSGPGSCPEGLVCAGDGRCRTPCSCQFQGSLSCGFGSVCPPWQACTPNGSCQPLVTGSCLWRRADILNVTNDCPRLDQACLAGACYGNDERAQSGQPTPPDIDSCVAGAQRCQTTRVSVCADRGPGWHDDVNCEPQTCIESCSGDAGVNNCPDHQRRATCGCLTFCDGNSTVRSSCPSSLRPVVKVCDAASRCQAVSSEVADCVPFVAAEPQPPLVLVGEPDSGVAFGIDATEVTRAQYVAFLNARIDAGRLLDPVPGGCAAASAAAALRPLEPQGWPWFDAPHRAASVNICAARAFCEWAGKRLCSSISPRPDAGLGALELNDAGVDAWFAACSSGGRNAYTFGNTWDASLCANWQILEVGDMDVGTFPGCQSMRPGWQGVFDMSGNRSEWTDTCWFDLQAGTTRCRARGDPRQSVLASDSLKCAYTDSKGLDDESPTFRCCSR